jgi:hypothetical protein
MQACLVKALTASKHHGGSGIRSIKHIIVSGRRRTVALLTATIACAALLSSVQVRAQTMHQKEAIERIAPYYQELVARHRMILRGLNTVPVLRDGRVEHRVFLEGGRQHALVLGCDLDCDPMRLDATLYDGHGNVVGYRDPVLPIVVVTPVRSGTYYLNTRVNNCRDIACEIGVAHLSR